MRALLVAILLATVPPALAREAPASEGSFVPSSAVDALSEPNGRRVVTRLVPGRAYRLEKQGGPGRAWCKLATDAGPGWVECAAGRMGSAPERDVRRDEPRRDARTPSGRTCATTCSREPLFESPPPLTKLDREVLALCPAHPNAAVTLPEVRRFFASHYDDPRIQRALSAAGRPGSGAGVKERNVEWLASLWVSTGPRNAFTHVFCGDDWDRDKVGGLHWLPRYAQLESEGKVCYGGPVKKSAKVGDQYLIRYSGLAPWSCGEKPVGGFGTDDDPVSIAAIATRAFVRCCHRGGKDGGVYTAPDLNGERWQIWCGTRNGTYGIATIHPTDARTTCGE